MRSGRWAYRLLALGILLQAAGLFTTNARSAPAEAISIWVDASLLYSDQLKRPNTSADNVPGTEYWSSEGEDHPGDPQTPNTRGTQLAQSPSASASSATSQRSRLEPTLGLRHLRLGLRVATHESSAIEMILRPDATLERHEQDPESYEFDGRAGYSHRARPKIELLDSYNISLNFSPTARVSLGVFDDVLHPNLAYESPLEHGLMVEFPKKTFAAEVRYEIDEPPQPLAQPYIEVASHYRLLLFNGRQDRGEAIRHNDSAYSNSSSAEDPYIGMAGEGTINAGAWGRFAIFAGYFDTKLTVGQVNESLLALRFNTTYTIGTYFFLSAAEYRIARERWREIQTQNNELTQSSLTWTNLVDVTPTLTAAFGFHYGISESLLESETSTKNIQKGYQVDFGAIHHTATNLQSRFFIAIENRTASAFEDNKAFTTAGESTSYLQRMALEVTYILNRP